MYLTISDLRLIIQHLVTEKWELLMRFAIAVVYGPLLKGRLTELEALEERLQKRPLAEALKAADVTYDLFGRAVYYLCRVLSPLKLLPEDEQALLVRTQAAFIPTRSEIARPFQEEADAAKQRRPKLEAMAAELKAFPIGTGMTLYDIVAAYLDAGVEIDTLLGQRADTTAATFNSDAASATRLRSTTIGLLSRLRQAVDDEIASNPALSSKMSVELFTHMDQLSDVRMAHASRSASKSESDSDKTENPPAPGSTDPIA